MWLVSTKEWLDPVTHDAASLSRAQRNGSSGIAPTNAMRARNAAADERRTSSPSRASAPFSQPSAYMITIDETLHERKTELLDYFRHRAAELLAEVTAEFGEARHKKRAAAMNKALQKEKDSLATLVRQKATKGNWAPAVTLRTNLLLMHSSNVVMLESRNDIWPYEYMAFSRRVGELWEPFCTACFDPPTRPDVELFVPPLFDEVKTRMEAEVGDFIQALPLSDQEKQQLLSYYHKVWMLVTSGEIKLALDLHFTLGGTRFVVDFKSGFSSNEKGNTNRLLLVASIYKNIEPQDYRCLLLVRSAEEANNHYLQTLRNSGLWEVSCGTNTYQRVAEFSGFDLAGWIGENVSWESDFRNDTWSYLQDQDLAKYLQW